MDADEQIPRFLINSAGEPFTGEISDLRTKFESLSNTARKQYRDDNAEAIVSHAAARLLIVAGPGSGKSYLFRARISRWLTQSEDVQIYVSSFVRKLVHDLETEIANDHNITDDDRLRVTISTLHTLARSTVERSGGTRAHPLRHHVQVIAGDWEALVWADALQFRTDLGARDYAQGELARQFHTEELRSEPEWEALREVYAVLGRFYNAVGFADMIVLAREAIDEQPELNQHLLWIVDEYQDFNIAEDHLVRSLTEQVTGVLIAGDDEQVLYQELKSSIPEIIVSYYSESQFANGMLPFCSRCGYFVCLAASAFIQNHRAPNAIDKVFLPLKVDTSAAKVQVVAAFQPTSAVDYIAKFIEDHRSELEAHIALMQAGEEVDPFLLVLTPEKTARFYRDHHANEQLSKLLGEFSVVSTGHTSDYWKVATFCTVAWTPGDNFGFRKALHYQGVAIARVHELIELALSEGCSLSELQNEPEVEALATLAGTVGDLMEEDSSDPAMKSASVAALISIDDQIKLASELATDPIGILDDLGEEESQEAIETSGDVAAVEMMTIFRSKGLSAHHVIIIGCDDVNLGRTSALTFFVGMTRARKTLHLVTSMRAGGSSRAADFVLELPSEFCDYVEYKKSGRVTTNLGSRQSFVHLLGRWNSASRRR